MEIGVNYQEAYEYIQNIEKQGSVLGLELIRRLLLRLEDPQNRLPIVHVAGTNGKGSTIAFLDSILQSAGYRVGRYISPTVFGYLERFQINGKWMPEARFAELMTRIAPAAEAVSAAYAAERGNEREDGRMGSPIPTDACGNGDTVIRDAVSVGPHAGLTAYEIETAIAFLYFLEERCDIVLLETGLGGRDDATNVADRVLCSVLTAISLDHTRVLGSTVAQIASVKAGIIKPDCPVVVSGENRYAPETGSGPEADPNLEAGTESESDPKSETALSVIEAYAKRQHAPVTVTAPERVRDYSGSPEKQVFSYETAAGNFYEGLQLSVNGEFQVNNCLNALEVIEILRKKGYNISNEAIMTGVRRTSWSGRLERLGGSPEFYLDGAHNPGAIRVLRQFIRQYYGTRRLVFIIGVLADKDYGAMLESITDLADCVIATEPPVKRRLPAKKLAEQIRQRHSCVLETGSCREAVALALREAGREGVIFAFGSLYALGEIKGEWERRHFV